MTKPTDVLREYGEAIRGSWAFIDGRWVLSDLETIADLIEETGNCEMKEDDVLSLRSDLDICPHGKGHWTEFCDDSCKGE